MKKQVISMCICAGCPSYKDCGSVGREKELGFCFVDIGRSKCIKYEKGCICPSCPVTSKMGLKNTYYCTRDSEMVQEKEKMNKNE